MTSPEHKIADALREVALPIQKAADEGRRLQFEPDDVVEFLLSLADRLDPPVREDETQPSLLDAARALLEARDNQMVTHVEWDALRDALAAAGRAG